ncbi:hypothetical protein M992_1682 [Moellerella wisconsensis ATCC 35017]|uniref:Uncharacterized protein n=1 Tax=Moellerella wisconsensis ATCC 35017 TaxID=1354267 RepID=A0A0N0Z7X0_9GAMM|nr:hypothetical protein M992_1682 [Moellerella wisconsensis ATCC 35017]VFS48311.1 Uncharacterised protein [Moellerella wisconsensis]
MNNIIPLEYDGHPVHFNHDGWINAIELAAKFGKCLMNGSSFLKP